MDDRLRNIEEKHAFLEHQVEQLDEVIRELYGAMEMLRRELRRTQSHVQKVETRLVESLTDDEPPE